MLGLGLNSDPEKSLRCHWFSAGRGVGPGATATPPPRLSCRGYFTALIADRESRASNSMSRCSTWFSRWALASARTATRLVWPVLWAGEGVGSEDAENGHGESTSRDHGRKVHDRWLALAPMPRLAELPAGNHSSEEPASDKPTVGSLRS
jgi:hypothetical protein